MWFTTFFMALLGGIIIFFFGYMVGRGFKRARYDGVMRMAETDKGLVYSLELMQDPELLILQDEVIFRVDAPSYEKLLSRQ